MWDESYEIFKRFKLDSLARDITNNGLDGSLWEKVQEYLLVGTNSLIKQKNKSFQQ
ncbi:15818_t:CDS:1, partial [Funneliformis geosporum]